MTPFFRLAQLVNLDKEIRKYEKQPVPFSTGAIDTATPVGLRDKALIAIMAYDFARIGAVIGMNVEDYYQSGKRWALCLHEKGGKRHEMLAHHLVEEALDAYLDALGPQEKRSPGEAGSTSYNPTPLEA